MDKLQLVTYCGLYCDLCAQRGRIPQCADKLRQAMILEGYELWGPEIAGFNDFWKFLNNLTDPEKSCPGCRQGGGYPQCAIRKCAKERKIDICPLCEKYPCSNIEELAKRYGILITNGRRLQRIGIDKWIEEQKECAKSGFQYADIRSSHA